MVFEGQSQVWSKRQTADFTFMAWNTLGYKYGFKNFISLLLLLFFFNYISFLWQCENVTVKDRKREKVENIL